MNKNPESAPPEKTDLRLGFIPLVDCCVLAIAKEKGCFEKYGLNVTLSREASWANIRDKVCVGALDGAHMLAGMPIATTIGLGYYRKPMLTAFSMNLNGNAVTVSNRVYEQLCELEPEIRNNPLKSAEALKRLLDQNAKAGKSPLTFAMVYPYSNHNYEIRYWLASAGIHPDRDIRMIVIPPQYMVENLRTGHIDGYCVGEPWSSLAVHEGAGKVLITGFEIWNNAPEKVFGVTQEWASQHPNTHIAILKALLEAARWLDEPQHRAEAASIIASNHYTGVSADIISMSLTGTFLYSPDNPPRPLPDMHVFHRYQTNFPWRSHALWIISQMYRWGQLDKLIDHTHIAETVYRPDIYRIAAAALNIPSPAIDSKSEGTHAGKWELQHNGDKTIMGSDHFMDERVFHPDLLPAYVSSFTVNSSAFKLDSLSAQK